MPKFLNKKSILFLFLFLLLLIDFFIVGRFDPICYSKQGYGFSYATGESAEVLNSIRFSPERIGYNFSHFSLFWTKPSFGKNFNSLIDFLKLDGNPLWLNIGHFVAFFIFTLILFYIFRLNFVSVFLINLVFNIFHEYIAEGICIDPSFNDLWVNTVGCLIGILFFILCRVRRKFSV